MAKNRNNKKGYLTILMILIVLSVQLSMRQNHTLSVIDEHRNILLSIIY